VPFTYRLVSLQPYSLNLTLGQQCTNTLVQIWWFYESSPFWRSSDSPFIPHLIPSGDQTPTHSESRCSLLLSFPCVCCQPPLWHITIIHTRWDQTIIRSLEDIFNSQLPEIPLSFTANAGKSSIISNPKLPRRPTNVDDTNLPTTIASFGDLLQGHSQPAIAIAMNIRRAKQLQDWPRYIAYGLLKSIQPMADLWAGGSKSDRLSIINPDHFTMDWA
jgi:hypothetical protein